ncbi:hypothetical protein HDV06_005089 [Boothiomyces sp. JEL0866]|nr:hypothetical protein HDV06_005089 [Boothiomyces sp. JEL0866]
MLSVLVALVSLGSAQSTTSSSQAQPTPTQSTFGKMKRWGYEGYPGFGGYGIAAPGQFSGYTPYGAGAYNNGQFSGYGPGYAGAGTIWKRDAQSQPYSQQPNLGFQCYTAAVTFQNSPTLAQCARNACTNNNLTELQYCYQLQQSSSNNNGGQQLQLLKRFVVYGDNLGALASAQGLNQDTEWNDASAGDQGYGNNAAGFGGFPGHGVGGLGCMMGN